MPIIFFIYNLVALINIYGSYRLLHKVELTLSDVYVTEKQVFIENKRINTPKVIISLFVISLLCTMPIIHLITFYFLNFKYQVVYDKVFFACRKYILKQTWGEEWKN